MRTSKLFIAMTIGVILNIVLTVIKLYFGYTGHAEALISDGYNSLSDILMSLIILFVVRVSEKRPDDNHPYGHQKFEGLAYFAVGMIFLLTAILLVVDSITKMVFYVNNPQDVVKPEIITLYIAVVSLFIKVFLVFFYFQLYKKYQHPTLNAESKNHLTDLFSITVTIIGIGLSQFNLIIFDYIAALAIALFILRLAIKTMKDSVGFLVDQAPVQQVVDHVSHTILSVSGVIRIDDLKIRQHMTDLYVDVEIAVDGKLSLKDAHQIAEIVHHKVEEKVPNVIHCMVHVNPSS